MPDIWQKYLYIYVQEVWHMHACTPVAGDSEWQWAAKLGRLERGAVEQSKSCGYSDE